MYESFLGSVGRCYKHFEHTKISLGHSTPQVVDPSLNAE